jgi:Ca2+-dependent lipid-binding protein
VEVSVPGSTPATARTKTVKSNLDPTFNETLVFLLVPGTDTLDIKVHGQGERP